MKKYVIGIFGIVFIILLSSLTFSSCRKEVRATSPNDIDFALVPYRKLSEYGFFAGQMKDLIPNDRVLLYKPASSLFSDYSYKSRFVWMPQGVSASIMNNEVQEIDFPNEAVLIKNFYYPEDFQKPEAKRRIIETRLLVKDKDKWSAYAYLWNDDQTEAVYKIAGAKTDVAFTDLHGAHQQFEYIQPNKNQCKSCHNQSEKLMPIGPKVRNLNYSLDYGGELKNQMDKWTEMGYLTGYDKATAKTCMVDYNDETADLELRAKAYLDINCGHCHKEDGPASTSGLYLTYEETDDVRWGKFKTPIAAGVGAGPHKFGIYPGKADSSILVHRMNSTQPSVAMPEIGRVTIDKMGVALISDWINQMEDTERPK